MSTPAWILETFGAVMLLVAEVSAGQLVAARAWTRGGGPAAGGAAGPVAGPAAGPAADTAVSHVLMGIAMASVLVPGLGVLPHAAWAVVFAVMTAWFAWRLWRDSRGRGAAAVASGHDAPLLVHSAAMLYLFAALQGPSVADSGPSVSATGGMPGMPGMASVSSGSMSALRASTLALVFALLLIAVTVHGLDRRAAAARPVTPGQPAYAGARRLLLSPAVVKGCQVATGVTMAFILIIMI
jgi:Domain of unknown function (DUF5134)